MNVFHGLQDLGSDQIVNVDTPVCGDDQKLVPSYDCMNGIREIDCRDTRRLVPRIPDLDRGVQ